MKGEFPYTSKYINTVEKHLNEKLDNVDKGKTIEATKVFDHLKSLSLLKGNITSLSDLEKQ